MRRREFITLLSGAVGAWPLAARAQQPERMRIGFLSVVAESDPEIQTAIKELTQRLQELGWTSGRDVIARRRWTQRRPRGWLDQAFDVTGQVFDQPST